MRIYLPAPSDPIIAALGVAAAALTLFAMRLVLRAGPRRPGVAMFSKAFAILVVLLCLGFGAGAVAAWRELPGRADKDPAALVVMAIGTVFFFWGAIEALTRRLEWDEQGLRLYGFLRAPLTARWAEVAGAGFGRNRVWIDLKGPPPRRLAVSGFLVGLPAFVAEAARRTAP